MATGGKGPAVRPKKGARRREGEAIVLAVVPDPASEKKKKGERYRQPEAAVVAVTAPEEAPAGEKDPKTFVDALLRRATYEELRAFARVLSMTDPIDPNRGRNWIEWRLLHFTDRADNRGKR